MSNKPKLQPFSQRVASEIRGGRSMFSALFTSTWNSLGSWLGTYDAVDPRNVAMRGVIARPTSAADLTVATPYVRNLCRNYERNNATVRAATEGIVANVVGSGVFLEPDTGDAATDEKLRELWNDYINDCFIDRSGLYAGQTQGMRDVVIAGELLWRLVIDPDRAKDGLIPLCVMPLEAEWLGDSGQTVVGQTQGYVGGVKLDQFGRPIAYSLRSPSGIVEDVPSRLVIHCYEKRRALQIRGEPWFSPILTTLRQEKDLVTAELEAAKNTAGYAAAITTNGGLPPDMDEKGDKVRDISVGSVLELQQGEGIQLLSHTRPSQQIKPFRDMLRGDMAASSRIGKRWLDRDISGANYSSMRADMLDSERLMGPVRAWFGNGTAGKLYAAILPYLCAKAGIPVPRCRYRLVPDGQPYVDPLKDAQAAAMAISFGLSTYEQEIGKRGRDYKQVWAKLAEEKKLMDQLGLVLQTPSGTTFGEEPQEGSNADKKESGSGGGDDQQADRRPSSSGSKKEERSADVAVRALDLARSVVGMRDKDIIVNVPPQTTSVNIRQEAQGAPIVNVSPSAAQVQVVNEIRQPEQPPAVVNVNVQSATPDITVQPSTASVEIENNVTMPQRTVRAVPQPDGSTLIKPIEK